MQHAGYKEPRRRAGAGRGSAAAVGFGVAEHVRVLDDALHLVVRQVGEDGGGGNYIRGVTQDGQIFDFAHNVLNSGEFAGVCFSPDGRALFANLWGSGLTFVITGPFPGVPQGDPGDSSGDSASDSSK